MTPYRSILRRSARRLRAQAVDRSERVRLESDDDARTADAAREAAVPRSRAGVLRSAAAGVAAAAALALVAHHDHERDRARLHRRGAAQVSAHPAPHRSVPAAEPAEPRLSCDSPHEGGLVALPTGAQGTVGAVGGLERVHVPALAAEAGSATPGRPRAGRRPGPRAGAGSAGSRGPSAACGPGLAPAGCPGPGPSAAAVGGAAPPPGRRPGAPARTRVGSTEQINAMAHSSTPANLVLARQNGRHWLGVRLLCGFPAWGGPPDSGEPSHRGSEPCMPGRTDRAGARK